MRERPEITVGTTSGDIRGDDHRALQAAVDYVAGLGGGTVRIGPGRYTMRNALFLRDNVRVVGDPGRTILVAAGGVETPLRLDGDCNERKVTLVDPSGFRVGDGISVRDDRKGGFGVTTATLVAKVGTDAFAISRPLYHDYMVSRKATARLVFPVVAGYQVKDASIEGITVDGNRENMPPLNGCRGAGIYLFECERITIIGCVVRNYNGDGISFQVSQEVTVEECLSEGNAGIGIHPGSGSGRPVLRRNRSIENDGDGIFVCWRVKHGLFEDNLVRGNRGHGVSIGHKDTDNLFRRNRILENRRSGVAFRDESEPMGAHRNVFEENEILDNGIDQEKEAQVRIRGHTNDLVFRRNKIGFTAQRDADVPAFRVGEHAKGLRLEDNTFLNVRTERGEDG